MLSTSFVFFVSHCTITGIICKTQKWSKTQKYFDFKRTEAGISPSHTPYVYKHIVKFYTASNYYYTLYAPSCKGGHGFFYGVCADRPDPLYSINRKRITVMPGSVTVIFYYGIYINVGQAVIQIWLSLLKADFLHEYALYDVVY